MIHPFLRGVDPNEPFDPMAYAVELGKALLRKEQARQASLSASTLRASKILGNGYGLSDSKLLQPVHRPSSVRHKSYGMTDKILKLLATNGPMTVGQLRIALGYYQVAPLLHGLKKQGKVVAEGLRSSRSMLWKVRT